MGLSQASSVAPHLVAPAAAVTFHANSSGASPASSCSIDESYKYVFLPVCYSLTFLFSLTLNSVVLLRSCRHQDGCRGGRRCLPHSRGRGRLHGNPMGPRRGR